VEENFQDIIKKAESELNQNAQYLLENIDLKQSCLVKINIENFEKTFSKNYCTGNLIPLEGGIEVEKIFAHTIGVNLYSWGCVFKRGCRCSR